MPKIIFTEPSTYNTKNKFVKQKAFNVTDVFYEVLLKKPKSYKGNGKNAYLFGKKFKPEEYKKIRTHGNDGAQTGLIDVKLWKDGIYGGDEALKINKKYDYSYDTRKNVLEIRKLTGGAVIFQGETCGGDIGADLYVHYDSAKNIDSLIIDNFFFFPSPDDDLN